MTESFTSLKGFNSFNDVDLLNQVQQSVISFFDWGFLNKGAFTNVLVNQTDINSNNQSILRKVKDSSYSNGQVWETFHHNIVWESGLQSSSQPIRISGVYVDGTFRTPTSVGYEHYVDYPNGRVIFNAAQSASTVKMEYSYKNILFDRFSTYPEISNLQFNAFSFSNYTGFSSGDYFTLLRKQMPLVAVEVTPRLTSYPVSLGTGAQWIDTDILMHIFDTNDIMVKKLMSFISLQKEKTIYMLNMNLINSSGVYPISYNGGLINSPKTYDQLINGGYRDSQLYFTDAISTLNSNVGGDIHYGTVRFTTETISAL